MDEIPKPDDPVLRSIRDLLQAEHAQQTDADRSTRRLRWLTAGDVVQRLFAGETLAKNTPRPGDAEQISLALVNAFVREQDAYVKFGLGIWMWEQVYPRAGEAARINIVNVTVEAASSSSNNLRMLALDRLSEADPELLRKPGVKSSREVVQLLEDRRQAETDAGVRDTLDRVIAALRR